MSCCNFLHFVVATFCIFALQLSGFIFYNKHLNSTHAHAVFLKSNSRDAKKILAVEEITVDKLKDVPYELLAQELAKRMIDIKYHEIVHLRDDSDYSAKRDALDRVFAEVKFVLDEIGGE